MQNIRLILLQIQEKNVKILQKMVAKKQYQMFLIRLPFLFEIKQKPEKNFKIKLEKQYQIYQEVAKKQYFSITKNGKYSSTFVANTRKNILKCYKKWQQKNSMKCFLLGFRCCLK